MFSLHEITKIRLCRAAFIALCVVPTCAVVFWCVAVRLPIYRQIHERLIAAEFGLHAQLFRVTTPRPGTTIYERLDLFDPETKQLLARLPFVEMESGGADVTVTLPFPSIINGTRLDLVWQSALAHVRESRSWQRLRFEARNLTLHLNHGDDQTLTELHGEIRSGTDDAQMALSFRLATSGENEAEPSQVTLVRHRASKPTSEFQFITGNSPLPCCLAASVVPNINGLGKASTFQGTISATESGSGWTTSLKGELVDVNLDGLFRGRFQHRLGGTARVRLDGVTVRGGRIEVAAGQMIAGPGVISRSLINSAQSSLKLNALPAAMSGSSNVLNYHQLCLEFQVDADGITVLGTCPQQPGAILIDHQGLVLVRQGKNKRQPALNLLRTLVPNGELQVPVAQETDWLSHVLPVPSVNPRAGNEEPLPRATKLDVIRR